MEEKEKERNSTIHKLRLGRVTFTISAAAAAADGDFLIENNFNKGSNLI